MHKLRYLLKESFQLPQTVKVEEQCGWNDEGYFHINEFAQWCQKNLGLPNLPEINIVADRSSGITTGGYDPETHVILVLGAGRALVDVMRTLAHELTHYRQRLQDKIKSTERDWNLEGEADAEAGKMVYTYTHASPENMGVYEL